MIPSPSPSPQNHYSWLVVINVFLLLYSTGSVGGAKLTIENRCSEPIWPVVLDNATQQSAQYEVFVGSSVAFQRASGWSGRVWAKTGCVFNDSGTPSCATGDETPFTVAEFNLSFHKPEDLYDVSLVSGYNLPLVVKPVGGCSSTGCVDDLNRVCPTELRAQGGAACQGPCLLGSCCTWIEVGPTGAAASNPKQPAAVPTATSGQPAAASNPEQQTSGLPQSKRCKPTPSNYSQLFKTACPTAYTYPSDDAIFTCTNTTDYFIIFCPPQSFLGVGLPPAPSPAYPPQSFNNNPQQTKGPTAPSPAYPPQSFNNNPQQTKPGKNRAKEIITIVSVTISGVIIISIIICCFLKRRRHSQNGPKLKCKRDVENLLLQHGSVAPKRYRYSEIKKMTKSLSDKLGQGGFGSVYKGMLPDGRLVAVKILIEIMDSNGEEFINEVASISRTSHVNIVSLLGFCYEANKSALVYEYMPNKSLDKFLGHDGDGLMDLKKLYEIAVGIAKGLEYLHTGCTTRIVHFDIKPQNILLDDDLCPKISDFGMAKLCKKKQSKLSVFGTRGTAGYIAPEVFSRSYGDVSHKSDVYSYGMMLLEMAGAKKNVGIQVMQSSEDYFPDKIYEQVVIDVTSNLDDQSMMIEEEEKRRKMMLIGFWCIQTTPSDRPSMSKVVEMLEGSLHESIQIPPKPNLFPTVTPHQQTSSSSSSSSFSANVGTDKAQN